VTCAGAGGAAIVSRQLAGKCQVLAGLPVTQAVRLCVYMLLYIYIYCLYIYSSQHLALAGLPVTQAVRLCVYIYCLLRAFVCVCVCVRPRVPVAHPPCPTPYTSTAPGRVLPVVCFARAMYLFRSSDVFVPLERYICSADRLRLVKVTHCILPRAFCSRQKSQTSRAPGFGTVPTPKDSFSHVPPWAM